MLRPRHGGRHRRHRQRLGRGRRAACAPSSRPEAGAEARPDNKGPESGVRVRYFGHACLLIETPTTTILVDPTFAMDRLDDTHHLTFADLPGRIDAAADLGTATKTTSCPRCWMQIRGSGRRGPDPADQSRRNRRSVAETDVGRAGLSLDRHVSDLLDVHHLPDGQITAPAVQRRALRILMVQQQAVRAGRTARQENLPLRRSRRHRYRDLSTFGAAA
ncbi:MBL fold metallo-hydrolase [Caulobacter segnis]